GGHEGSFDTNRRGAGDGASCQLRPRPGTRCLYATRRSPGPTTPAAPGAQSAVRGDRGNGCGGSGGGILAAPPAESVRQGRHTQALATAVARSTRRGGGGRLWVIWGWSPCGAHRRVSPARSPHSDPCHRARALDKAVGSVDHAWRTVVTIDALGQQLQNRHGQGGLVRVDRGEGRPGQR